jgi:hypothetical protein
MASIDWSSRSLRSSVYAQTTTVTSGLVAVSLDVLSSALVFAADIKLELEAAPFAVPLKDVPLSRSSATPLACDRPLASLPHV